MHEMHDVGSVIDNHHGTGIIDPNGAKYELELDAKLESPFHEDDVSNSDDQS